MKVPKQFAFEFRQDQANIEYCCYCGTERGDRISCCEENHWETFKDLPAEVQEEMIEEAWCMEAPVLAGHRSMK